MNTSDYNRLKEYRLTRLNQYTGNTYQVNAYQGTYEIVRIGERLGEHATHGGKFHLRRDVITALDAMIYAIETVTAINEESLADGLAESVCRIVSQQSQTESYAAKTLERIAQLIDPSLT